MFDYLDPQWQWVMNAGWNKGVHNVKFGVDVHRLHMNHYEITAPSFSFTGGASALNATGAAAPNLFNGYADFLLGLPITYRDDDFAVVATSDHASGLAFQRAPDNPPPTWPDASPPDRPWPPGP